MDELVLEEPIKLTDEEFDSLITSHKEISEDELVNSNIKNNEATTSDEKDDEDNEIVDVTENFFERSFKGLKNFFFGGPEESEDKSTEDDIIFTPEEEPAVKPLENDTKEETESLDIYDSPVLESVGGANPTTADVGGEVKVEKFSVDWIDEFGKTRTSDNGHIHEVWTDSTASPIRTRINLAVSGSKDYAPGTMQIKFPKQIFRNRDGNPVGSMTLAVPKMPGTGNLFAYIETTDSYIITNVQTIPAASNLYFQSTIWAGNVSEIKDFATEYKSDPFKAEVKLAKSDGTQVTATTNELTADIDSYAKVTEAEQQNRIDRNVYEYWPGWDEQLRPSDEVEVPIEKRYTDGDKSKYVYASWDVNAKVDANQYYSMLVDTQANSVYNTSTGVEAAKPIILGYRDNRTGTYHKATPGTTSMNDISVYKDGTPLTDRCFYGTIYVAYPKENLQQGATYDFKGNVKYKLTATDDKQVTEASKELLNRYTMYKPKYFGVKGQFGLSKNGRGKHTEWLAGETWGVYYYNIDKILKDKTSDFEYAVHQTAEGFPWTVDFEITQDNINNFMNDKSVLKYIIWTLQKEARNVSESEELKFINLSTKEKERLALERMSTYTTDEAKRSILHDAYMDDVDNYGKIPYTMETVDNTVKLGGTELSEEDYRIKSIRLAKPRIAKFAKLHPSTVYEEWEYETKNDDSAIPQIKYYGKTSSGDYTLYGAADFTLGSVNIQTSNGATTDGSNLILPEGSNIVDIKVECETKEHAVYYTFYPTIELKPSTKVKGILSAAKEVSDKPEVTLTNSVEYNVYNTNKIRNTNGKLTTIHDTGKNKLLGYSDAVRLDKSTSYRNDVVNRVVNVSYTVTMNYDTNLVDLEDIQDAIVDGVMSEEKVATWYDLLPPGVTPNLQSIRGRSGDKVTGVQLKENYKGTGRDLIIVNMELTPDYKYKQKKYNLMNYDGYSDMPRLRFDAVYSWESLGNFGPVTKNYAVYQSGNSEIGSAKGYQGEDNINSGLNRRITGDAEVLNAINKPGGEVNGKPYLYTEDQKTFIVDIYTLTNLTKMVDVNREGVYKSGRENDIPKNVYANGIYSYRLNVQTPIGVQASNIILYDKLDSYVPTNNSNDYKDTTWRGTFRGVDLAALKERGVAPVVYYSTDENINISEGSSDIKLNSGKWTTTKPTDLSAIKAVAIDCTKKTDGADFVLDEDDSITVYINMKAPKVNNTDWYDTELKVTKPAECDELGIPTKPAEYEKEAGIVGGAHAYNSGAMTVTNIQKETKTKIEGFVEHKYTKVGLKPYSVEVIKKWDDDNNRDGIRPNEITMKLLANNKALDSVEPIKLNSENKWSGKFENLSPVDEEGQLINYTIQEDKINGYVLKTDSVKVNDKGKVFNVTNYHEPEKITIKGKKVWEGDELNKDERPGSIGVGLYSGDKLEYRINVMADADGNWNYEFKDIFKNENGKPINYKIKETNEYIPGYRFKEIKGWNIINEYYPKGDLVVTKKLENATPEAYEKGTFEFEFKITNNEGAPLSDEFVYEKINSKNEKQSGKITSGGVFTLKADETFRIKELPYRNTATVTEKPSAGFTPKQAKFSIEIKSGIDNTMGFVNVYNSKGNVEFDVKKELTGRTMKIYEFMFDLYDESDKIIKSASNDLDGKVTFGILEYTTADAGKTFKYKIKERDLDKGGITYDKHVEEISVKVTDNGDGTVTATPTYDSDGAIFKNKYEAKGEANIVAYKQLKGKYTNKNGTTKNETFKFQLLDGRGKVVSKGTSDKNGKIAFSALKFTHEDVGKTYKYVAKEVIDTNRKDLKYDQTTIEYTVKVFDNGDGTLSFESTANDKYTEDSKNDQTMPLFVNKYNNGKLTISKKLNSGDISQSFTFKVRLSGNKEDIPEGSFKINRKELPKPVVVRFEVEKGASPDNIALSTEQGKHQFTVPGDGLYFVDDDSKPIKSGDTIKYNVDDKGNVTFTDYKFEIKDNVVTFKSEPYFWPTYGWGEDGVEPVKTDEHGDKYTEWNHPDGTNIRFYGEVKARRFITGDKLASSIGLTEGESINSETEWFRYLVNGEEFYIPKKPFRYGISWDQINDANAVFGDKTVTINGKTYKVRLLRAFNNSATSDVRNTPVGSYKGEKNKGSEWNKLILPLVVNQDGQCYGSNTKGNMEPNIPQLAKYNWFTDDNTNKVDSTSQTHNLGASDYSKDRGVGNGQWRWTQEYTTSSSLRSCRGSGNPNLAAAYSSYDSPGYTSTYQGWLPVLTWTPSTVSRGEGLVERGRSQLTKSNQNFSAKLTNRFSEISQIIKFKYSINS